MTLPCPARSWRGSMRSALDASSPRNCRRPLPRALHCHPVPVIGADGQLERLDVRDLAVRRGVPSDDLRQGLDVARQACKPAGPADAYAAVVPLVRLAAKRAEGDLDAALRREVWARELAEFPADLIGEAARAMMRRLHFLPHLSEIIAEIERNMAPRRQLVRAIERALAEPDADATPKPTPPASRAERLADVIRAHTERGEQHRAAGAEVELAKLEQRAPATSATRPKPSPRPTPPRPLSPMDSQLEHLAIAARRRLMGEP